MELLPPTLSYHVDDYFHLRQHSRMVADELPHISFFEYPSLLHIAAISVTFHYRLQAFIVRRRIADITASSRFAAVI
jgi:hypothetical protein